MEIEEGQGEHIPATAVEQK